MHLRGKLLDMRELFTECESLFKYIVKNQDLDSFQKSFKPTAVAWLNFLV